MPDFGGGGQGEGIKRAARAELEATREQIEFQREQLGIMREDLAQAVDAGLIDLQDAYNIAVSEIQPYADRTAYNQALQYLKSPQDVMSLPGVQFQYEQGQDALANLLSKTTGGGISSDIMRAAQEYGQGFAGTQLDAALNRLMPFVNMGYGASTNLANLATGLGAAQSGLRMSGATGQAGATGQMAPLIAQNIGDIGNIRGQRELALGQLGSQQMGGIGSLLGGGAGLALGGLPGMMIGSTFGQQLGSIF